MFKIYSVIIKLQFIKLDMLLTKRIQQSTTFDFDFILTVNTIYWIEIINESHPYNLSK